MNLSLNQHCQRIKSILVLGFVLAKAGFKLRNEGSYLGIFWYLLNPLLIFSLLFFIFSDRLGGDIQYYPLYLLLGVIMFNFFQNSTIDSVVSILKEDRLVIKSINFPRESLIVAIVFKNLFSHFFELAFFIVFLLFFKLSIIGILYYFLILFLFCFFIFGFSLILSSMTVYFVDLESIWSFVVRLLWIGTPIFYSIAGQLKLYYVNLFNPLYYFITISRDLIIYQKTPDANIIIGTILYTVLFSTVGVLIFNFLKPKFAEKI